ncbi:hypothetical protein TNCV_725071 [Trichonephila clavipes]|nr:hypothetical protein TNCV_725071 [Trichonephila clavipes]
MNDSMPLIQFSARSPELTRWDFFLWGKVKDKVLVPLLPVDLAELKQRIAIVIDGLDSDTLIRVWAEMNYWLVSRETKGSHMEHL